MIWASLTLSAVSRMVDGCSGSGRKPRSRTSSFFYSWRRWRRPKRAYSFRLGINEAPHFAALLMRQSAQSFYLSRRTELTSVLTRNLGDDESLLHHAPAFTTAGVSSLHAGRRLRSPQWSSATKMSLAPEDTQTSWASPESFVLDKLLI